MKVIAIGPFVTKRDVEVVVYIHRVVPHVVCPW